MTQARILIVEDDKEWQEIYQRSLSGAAYEITGVRKVREALSLLNERSFDVVITDLNMRGGEEEFSGFGVLERANAKNPSTQVIVVTGFGSIDHAIRTMGNGAYDYITKGPDVRKKLALAVKGALEVSAHRQVSVREPVNGDVIFDANQIIGNSSSMRVLFEQISQSSENEINVLIQGESGTGKRLIAQTIHLRSSKKGPFLVVDCGRLSETVLEVELFGYEAGAIAGVKESRPGKFEQAHDGTIFLERFGNLNVHLQPRLIGVICDRQVERIGGKAPIAINARIIASTDKDLQALSKAGQFERTLFDALGEYVITVPPLRKRKDGHDIPALAAMFLKRFSKYPKVEFSKEAIELLNNYDYPGNVRELESIVKHALSVSRGSTILPEHLRPELRGPDVSSDEEQPLPREARKALGAPTSSKVTPASAYVAHPKQQDYEQSVFVSYAWGDEREEIVNQIERSLQRRGVKIIRDKRDLVYKGSIREFMERIGKGDCVIVVISDKYLRSPNCMFELVEIAENKEFWNRVFPIIWKDANIYDPLKRIEYIEHWETARAKLAKAMKKLDPANLQGIREEMDLYARIRDKISGLTSILKDMNTLTPEMHRDSDFSEMYDAIEAQIRNGQT